MTPIYTGPLARTCQILKRLSIASFGISLTATPFLILAPNISTMAGISMSVVAIFTSGMSSAFVHYCVNPYVVGIHQENGRIALDTWTVFGNKFRTIVEPQDLTSSSGRPFSTWCIKNESKGVEQGVVGPEGRLVRRRWMFPRRYFYAHDVLVKEELKQVLNGL